MVGDSGGIVVFLVVLVGVGGLLLFSVVWFLVVCVCRIGCSRKNIRSKVKMLIRVILINLFRFSCDSRLFWLVKVFLFESVVKGRDFMVIVLLWFLLNLVVEVISLCSDCSLVLLWGISLVVFLVLVWVMLLIRIVMVRCCVVLGWWLILCVVWLILKFECWWFLDCCEWFWLLEFCCFLGRFDVVVIVLDCWLLFWFVDFLIFCEIRVCCLGL